MMNRKSILAETERLLLRRYEEDDLQDLFEYLSNPKVVKYEPYKTKTLKETEDNLKWRVSSDEMIAVELKSTGKMIGDVYLGKRDFESLEIGYVFKRIFGTRDMQRKAVISLWNWHFKKVSIEFTRNAILTIKHRGDYWRVWTLPGKDI
jgi:RimJ/RimL family protein N-acetyltransferase